MNESTARCILLCPEYFDGRRNGIGRVSEAMFAAVERSGLQPVVWSANELQGVAKIPNLSFGRNYGRMIFEALLARCDRVCAIACLHAGLSPVARILAWRLGVPWLCWLHGVEVWSPLRVRTKWGLAGNPLLCSNSLFTKSRASAINPDLDLDSAQVVPLGWMMPGTPDLGGMDLKRRGVLAISRLSFTDRYKGVDNLIKAWSIVAAAMPEEILTIVGSGDDLPRLIKLTLESGVATSVKFTGSLSNDDLVSQFKKNAIFALPSAGEGFGLVFAEAMAYGLPCVCGNTDASSEVVSDGLNGYCVDPESPNEIANALLGLLKNPRLLQDFSLSARQAFLEKYDVSAVRRRMDSLVKLLLSRCVR